MQVCFRVDVYMNIPHAVQGVLSIMIMMLIILMYDCVTRYITRVSRLLSPEYGWQQCTCSNVRSKLQVDVGHKGTSLSGVSHPLLMSSIMGSKSYTSLLLNMEHGALLLVQLHATGCELHVRLQNYC